METFIESIISLIITLVLLITILVLLINIANWKHTLLGLFGAFFYGYIGSFFSEIGAIYGAVIGFLIVIQGLDSEKGKEDAKQTTPPRSDSTVQSGATIIKFPSIE
jgi:uncharacterized membrane protein